MNGNKNVEALIELEMLGLKFATGHSFEEEATNIGAWVFSSPKNKRNYLNDQIHDLEKTFSMFSVSSKNKFPEAYVVNSVEKDCKDIFFDNDGKANYYEIIKSWRENLNDKNILTNLEKMNIKEFGLKRDPEILHNLNTMLLQELSTNAEYVKDLRENVQGFLSSTRRLKPQYSNSMDEADYLNSMVKFAELCNKQYQANKLSNNFETQMER